MLPAQAGEPAAAETQDSREPVIDRSHLQDLAIAPPLTYSTRAFGKPCDRSVHANVAFRHLGLRLSILELLDPAHSVQRSIARSTGQ